MNSGARSALAAVMLSLMGTPSVLGASADSISASKSLAALIERADQQQLPAWATDDFSNKMEPYLTRDFIAAIESGRKVASGRDLDVWDGDLFTGAQMMVHEKLWRVKAAAAQRSDVINFDAALSTADSDTTPSDPGRWTERFSMKFENNVWKLDDLVFLTKDGEAANLPGTDRPLGLKEYFSAPQLYVQPRALPQNVKIYLAKLPLRFGRYAQGEGACPNVGGDYLSSMTFTGSMLSNPLIGRSIDDIYALGDQFYLHLTLNDQAGRPASLTWKLKPLGATRFSLIGADRNGDWSGTYRRCGDAPSPQESKRRAPASAATTVRARLDLRNGVYNGERGIRFLHNDSWVWVFRNAGLIVYDKPSHAMKGLAQPGDVLFRGSISLGRVAGSAFAFRRGCPPVSYEVEGPGMNEDPAATFIVNGRRILRTGSTCAPSDGKVVAETLEFDGEAGIGD